MRCSKNNSKEEVYNNKCLHQKRRAQIYKLIPQGTRKEQTKPKVSKWKEITKT